MVKLFNQWEVKGITVADMGLAQYINLDAKIAPSTYGRNTGVRFHKNKTTIFERLMNKLMISGHKGKKHLRSSAHNTGKKYTNYLTVKKAFEIIEKKLKKNPAEIFISAVENAAPREEIVTIEYGGARYPKAVEVSPQRRIDIVLRMMTQGAYNKSFKSKKSIENTLADEIIAAYQSSAKSNAIAKKRDLERQAASSK